MNEVETYTELTDEEVVVFHAVLTKDKNGANMGVPIRVKATYPMMKTGPFSGCRRLEVAADEIRLIKSALGAGPYFTDGGIRSVLFCGGIHHAG